MEKYILPDLPYAYNALAPHMSEEVLKLHHDKHHASYVNTANALLDKIDEARKSGEILDFKSVLKSLSFNVGGHILHEIFWKTMAPEKSGNNKPSGKMLEAIEKSFSAQGGPASGWDRFKTEFTETAKSVEGSGWAILAFHKDHGENGGLSIIQLEKHNVNLYPEQKILLCLDVWEHAYYLDYKNDRAKFIEQWWNIVNWPEVEKRFAE